MKKIIIYGIFGLLLLVFIGIYIRECVLVGDFDGTCAWNAWSSATNKVFGGFLESIRDTLKSFETPTQ